MNIYALELLGLAMSGFVMGFIAGLVWERKKP